MRSFRTGTTLVAGLLLAASTLAGCGGDTEEKSGENKELTVASLPLVDGAALHIALKEKLFEAEGLKVKVQPVQQSTKALPALVKGEVNVIAGANYVSFLRANEQGALKLRILNEAATLKPNMMNVLVMPKSQIKEAKDLEGKTVAVNLLNNIQSLTMNAILKANNVASDKIKYKQIPFPQMSAALEKGDVDAIHIVEPFLSDIQKSLGARVVLNGGSPPVADIPVSGYVTTEQFVTGNPQAAAAFQRAMTKAQQLASTDRKKVEEVLPGYAHIKPEVASVITLPGFPTSTNEVRMKRIVDLMSSQGLLKTAPDMKTLLYKPAA